VTLSDPGGTQSGPALLNEEVVIPDQPAHQGPSDIVFEDEHVTGQAPLAADAAPGKPEATTRRGSGQYVPAEWRGRGEHVDDWDAYGRARTEGRDELGLDAAWETAKLLVPQIAVPAEAIADLAVQKQEAVLDPETGEVLGAAVREPWSLTYTYGGDDPEALEALHRGQKYEDLTTNGPGLVRGPTGKAKLGRAPKPKGSRRHTTHAPQPKSSKVTGPTDAGAVIKNPPPAPTTTSRLKEQLFERPGRDKSATTLDAARRELAGEATGFDHITKVRQAQQGLTNRIETIRRRLGHPRLPEAERRALELELGEASHLLDYTRGFVP
jgi:hypothetical protein